jgi:hypothetical protein
MSSILGQAAPQVFACPKCGEMINTSMVQCAYCWGVMFLLRLALEITAFFVMSQS